MDSFEPLLMASPIPQDDSLLQPDDHFESDVLADHEHNDPGGPKVYCIIA